jgi:hypothetical protein
MASFLLTTPPRAERTATPTSADAFFSARPAPDAPSSYSYIFYMISSL